MWCCDVQRREVRGWMQMVLTPYDLFFWNKLSINLTLAILHLITLQRKPSWKMLTLCTLALLHHASTILPSSFFSMLSPSLLGVDCLSSPLLGGPGPPSHPSPELTLFSSGPRQRPALTSGTIISIWHCDKNVYSACPYVQTYLQWITQKKIFSVPY